MITDLACERPARLKFFALAIFCIAGFLFANDAFATTYYVKPAAQGGNDGNNGLSWGTAKATITGAKNVATSSGDIVEISGGTFAEQLVASYAGVTFKGSTEEGYNGQVLINAPSNGAQITGANVTIQNLNITGGDTIARRGIRIAAINATVRDVTIYNFSGIGVRVESASTGFLVNGLEVYGTNSISFQADAGVTGTVINSIFRDDSSSATPGSKILISGVGTNVNLYNSVVIAAYRFCIKIDTSAVLNIKNSILGGCGVGYTSSENYTVYSVSPGAGTVDYSIVNGFARFPHDYNSPSPTTLNSNVITNAFPYFEGWGVNMAYFVVSVDDRTNLDNAYDISQVLDGYGVHMTFFPNSPDLIEPADWTTIQSLVGAGHDIGSHANTNHPLTYTTPFKITYTGSDTNVTATVSSNGSSLSVTGDGGDDTFGPLNLTNPSYTPLIDLCTFIDAKANFTCAMTGEDALQNASYDSDVLEDAATVLPIGVATDIPFDNRLPSVGGRRFTEALTEVKAGIESGIGDGYSVVSFAYPGQGHDITVRNAVEDAGYTIARGAANMVESSYSMSNISDIFMSPMSISTDEVKGASGYDALTDTEKELRIRQFARSWSMYALQGGVLGAITIHGADTLSPTETGWLVDELIDNGVNVVSMRELITAIKAGWTTGDNRAYTKTFTNANDYDLLTQSPAIDAGTTIDGYTTDLLGNPFYGSPDLGPYEYQPSLIMGTDEPNITGSIRVYNDGKYRYSTTTSGVATADLTISPSGGWGSYGAAETRPFFIDTTITTWNTSGDYSKQWTESGTGSTGTTSHTVGDFNPGDYYTVSYIHATDPQATLDTYLADGSGQISFDYSVGYSDVIFNIDPDTVGPNIFNIISPSNYFVSTVNSPTFTWSAATDDESGLAKYQLFVDGSLERDDISSLATTTTATSTLNCGSHTWYIRAVDNAGNTTNSTSTFTYYRTCGNSVINSEQEDVAADLIKIILPNSASEIKAGSSTSITWESDSSAYVSIYYSLDDQVTFEVIKEYVQNNGQYSWRVPSGISGAAHILLELTDLAYTFDSDVSDEFQIISESDSATTTDSDVVHAKVERGINPFTGIEEEIDVVETGDYFTSSETSTVYYLDTDGTRRPFMNGAAYFTWADSWNEVMEVSGATLAEYTLGTPMLPREGVTMVKIQSDAKTYVIEGDNTLRWVVSEEVAEGLYGANWNAYIIDIEPTFFTKFIIGDDISDSSEIIIDLSKIKSRALLNV